METQEKFVIQYLPCVTQKFKSYCEEAVRRGASHSELRERFLVFAKEGESSAAHALWHCNKHKPLHEIVAELRKFASEKNPYACNLLANCLANQRNPECLIWYQIYDLNFTAEDPDFQENYAAAILKLKEPLNVEALKDVWRLLRAWREIEKTKSDDVLEGLYSALTKAAIKIKAKEFICDLYTWANAQEDNFIQRGINLPIQRQAAKDVVCGNLAAMLQNSEVGNIPSMPEYSQYFIGFEEHKPSEKHLKSWATLIINNKNYRAKLIAVSDQDLALQDMAKRVRNVQLLEYVMAGFKMIYGYEGQDAA